MIRLGIIGFFLGIDIILLRRFLLEPNIQELINSVKNKTYQLQTKNIPAETFSNTSLLSSINQTRQQNEIPTLEENQILNQAAHHLIGVYQQHDFNLEKHDLGQDLQQFLSSQNYTYRRVSNISILGPRKNQVVYQTWFNSQQEKGLLMDADFSQIGIDHQTIELQGQLLGMTVLVMTDSLNEQEKETVTHSHNNTVSSEGRNDVSPKKPLPTATPITIIATPPHAPNIPDQEVVDALNQYRATHGVHQLIIDQNLCHYAEKRVQDLIEYGGLDNHQGFTNDFKDIESLPESIKNYSGGTIGENLASQNCINSKTGESFVAETGTALIEWCFDSSTAGHREAQLNHKYNSVCVRHGNNMYVVIFGE